MSHHHHAQGKPAQDNAASCSHACAVPANSNDATPATGLRAIFRKAAAALGGGAGGLLAGHAGCIAAPLMLAAAGVTTATAGMSVLALAFSAAATAGGIYARRHMRGHKAGTWEKRLVIGGAVAGLLTSAALNLGGLHKHHHAPAEPAPATQPVHHHHNHTM